MILIIIINKNNIYKTQNTKNNKYNENKHNKTQTYKTTYINNKQKQQIQD